MQYKNEELPFVDQLFITFDHQNLVFDRTGIAVYADFMQEKDVPESEVIRTLAQLDWNRSDQNLLKQVHALNHRLLFQTIEAEKEKAYPLNVIVNGWKTNTISYFPPVKEDERAFCFFTKAIPQDEITVGVAAGTWKQIVRKNVAEKSRMINGENVTLQEVPGVIKKAMLIGFLNYVRKDAERRCRLGPPRLKQKKSNAT